MNVFSSLETTAEIAVTFAGFISIFLVLARREGPIALEVATLIRFILLGSIGVLFLAIVPLVAAGIGVSGTSLWRYSSCLALAGGFGVALIGVNQRRSLRGREVTYFVVLAWASISLGGLAHVANIIGWPISSSGGIYLAGIWLYLAVTSINLIDLVFRFALKQPTDS